MMFRVDESLLGRTIADPGLSVAYSPPFGWEEISGNMLRDLEQNTYKGAVPGMSNLKVMYGFQENASGSRIVIAKIKPTGDFDPSAALEEYRKSLETGNEKVEIRSGTFRHEALAIYQLLYMTSSTVVFKLILTNPDISHVIQVDFVIPRENYPQFVRVVESVIGSFRFIDSNKERR